MSAEAQEKTQPDMPQPPVHYWQTLWLDAPAHVRFRVAPFVALFGLINALLGDGSISSLCADVAPIAWVAVLLREFFSRLRAPLWRGIKTFAEILAGIGVVYGLYSIMGAVPVSVAIIIGAMIFAGRI